MPFLKMPNTTPPGGWRYFQPETRLWFNGDDQGYEDMVERIAHHRQYRKLPRQSLRETAEDVQNQICERLGPEHCRDMPSGSFWLKTDYSAGLSASSVLAGSKAFIDFLTEGTEQVALEQVKQRAEICRGCHLNTPLQGCGSCSTLMQMTAKICLELMLNKPFMTSLPCWRLKTNKKLSNTACNFIESTDEIR